MQELMRNNSYFKTLVNKFIENTKFLVQLKGTKSYLMHLKRGCNYISKINNELYKNGLDTIPKPENLSVSNISSMEENIRNAYAYFLK